MTTEAETKKKEQIKVRHTKHSSEEYSLTIEVENKHVGLSSHAYSHAPGNYSSIAIFDMTVKEMQDLARKIQERALAIRAAETEEKIT